MLDYSKCYSVAGYSGVAFYYRGPELERYYQEWWDNEEEMYLIDEEPSERETGMVQMVMVGDDRVFTVDPDDCAELEDSDYCSECGQIGCGWAE